MSDVFQETTVENIEEIARYVARVCKWEYLKTEVATFGICVDFAIDGRFVTVELSHWQNSSRINLAIRMTYGALSLLREVGNES